MERHAGGTGTVRGAGRGWGGGGRGREEEEGMERRSKGRRGRREARFSYPDSVLVQLCLWVGDLLTSTVSTTTIT